MRFKRIEWPTNKWLYLWGPKGVGKTEYVKQLFKQPLFCRHKDKLKQLNNDQDAVILNDMSFDH